MRGQPGSIDLAHDLVAFKVADGIVAAHANPIGLLTLRQKFARPIRDALLDQAKAWHGDNDRFGFECFGGPECDQTLARAARHDQSAARLFVADEVFLGGIDSAQLVGSRLPRLRAYALALQIPNDQRPICRSPTVEANFARVAQEFALADWQRGCVRNNRQIDVAANVPGRMHERAQLSEAERRVMLADELCLDGPIFAAPVRAIRSMPSSLSGSLSSWRTLGGTSRSSQTSWSIVRYSGAVCR